jgi:hypothetical protein
MDLAEKQLVDVECVADLMPHSPKGKRIIPNDLIRSSLFTVVNHKIKREYFKEKQLYSFGKTKIYYTGEELRQDDEDVWMYILYLASRADREFVEFQPYSFMREIDWPARTQYQDKLRDSLNRMSATNLIVSNEEAGQGVTLSLVRKFSWRTEEGTKLKRWKIWLEPELVKLFQGHTYSKVIWEQRKKLNPLAKWLHSYYSSHAEPFSLKVETLHAACGSKTKQQKHFKSSLRTALTDLVAVGFLASFFIDAVNKVHVTRVKKQLDKLHD